MRLKRFVIGAAAVAFMAGSAVAQTVQQPAAAGALDPTAGQAPMAPSVAPQFQMQDGVLATVNDSVITGYDLRQRMLLLIATTQLQPTQENLPQISQAALNALIDERLRNQEIAKFENLVISDGDVDQELAMEAQQVGLTLEDYMNFLTQTGIRPQTVREQMRTDIAWRELVRGRFQRQARVSKGALDAAMRQISEAASKKQYLIGEIFIEAARVGGQQAALDGANQLVQQLVQGAPFQAVAQRFSSAASSARGGDAGWVVEGAMQPIVQQALDQLNVGELSRPIPVEGGVYIIYMRDKRDGASRSLVQLKQVMIEIPEGAGEADVQAATARLTTLQPQLTCDNMLTRATSEPGLLGSELGESDVDNLAPQFQQVARSAAVGTISAPVRTPLGLHLIGVCGRRVGGADAPDPRAVEGQLTAQNLSNMDRRYMRDLRHNALIEYKQ